MKLHDLLPILDDDALERLSAKHLGFGGEHDAREVVCANLEGELRSPKHVRETVFNLLPPAFRVMELLLDAPEHAIPVSGLRERVMEETEMLAASVTSGLIASRNDGARLYRRVFVEARRSDLELDASECALLGVLRRELGMLQIEHFLLEHHADFHPFWNTDRAFLNAMNGLRTEGILFAVDGRLVLPDDIIPMVRQSLGLEMSSGARKRLVGHLTGQHCAEALGQLGLKTSGSKEERIQRVLESYAPPSVILDSIGIGDLREICRDLDVPVSGLKDELIARLVAHVAADKDIAPREPPKPEAEPEPRALGPDVFHALFSSLRQQELSDILSSIGSSRSTGTKEQLLQLLKDSRFSETTLLMQLGLKQLEAILERAKLKTGGPKRERVERLLASQSTG